LLEPARLTVIEYVLVETPSCAVTFTVITVEPTFRAIGVEAVPLITTIPLIRILAFLSCAVGVITILLVATSTEVL
jgi:hypothetical protein